MGFNKRLVSKETIESTINNRKPLSELFKADAIIFMDDIASTAYTLHQQGYTDNEIKKHLDGKYTDNTNSTI
jgi:hypothetical protein